MSYDPLHDCRSKSGVTALQARNVALIDDKVSKSVYFLPFRHYQAFVRILFLRGWEQRIVSEAWKAWPI